MMHSQFLLLTKQRFLPYFITQFLGAFNDNLFKMSLSVMVAYGLWDSGAWSPEILVSLMAGLFILPFILCAPLGGQLADKYDKDQIIRALKIAEIVIVLCIAAGFVLQSLSFLIFALFALAVQSALFSPSKYALLPQHLTQEELIGGNALVNTGTYIAILLGTILGGVLAVTEIGVMSMLVMLLTCAVIGYFASKRIPCARAAAPDIKLNFNTPAQALQVLSHAWTAPRGIFTAIIGAAWFFFIGALYLAQFPNYAQQIGVDNIVLSFFMALFTLGIGAGGLLNNILLQSKLETKYVPLAAILIAAFSFDLYFASAAFMRSETLLNFETFLAEPRAWRIILDLLGLSIAGGLYIVPLKALLQDRIDLAHKARILSGSTLMDALFMLISAIIAIGAFALGFAVKHLFLVVGMVSIVMALYLKRLEKEV